MKKGDTIIFDTPPSVLASASVGGKKESEGPISGEFDELITDSQCGENSWEKAESDFSQHAIDAALRKARLTASGLDAVFGGDLQCQCTATSYAMRGFDVPFAGLYGACSTMAEAVSLAACMVAGEHMDNALAVASSHFCAAERQYRTPLEYGGKRTPTSQWTVTGAGAAIISKHGAPPYINSVTLGRVRDYDITDINNMGAAMAPAAAETLLRYFAGTRTAPDEFDVVYTGDLGAVGSQLFNEILQREGVVLKKHEDCGLIVYSQEDQDVKSGGSGAGCSASVLCCHVLPRVKEGKIKRALFMSTGALMSQQTFLQGESIPCIAHLFELSGGDSQ